jgi:hypothetical protein
MRPPQTADPSYEFVIDKRTGQVRQAGAALSMGSYVKEFKDRAEQSLYVFAKGVLGLDRLTPSLHKLTGDWLQLTPPYRKLMLLPRDHLKTSLASRSLPIHLLIQPKDNNIYIPGKDGAETRIMLSTKTATNAEHQLRWIEGRFEACDILRALWPHRVWDDSRKQSPKWSASEMIIPRKKDYPEASIETIGVGGKVTGRHYDVMIKDDLIDIEDANSEIVMRTAIEWHKASRALFDHPDKGLEFILGTRWAVYDLYQDIMDQDDTVEVQIRSVIEDGKPIFPEFFSMETIHRLKRELGPMFWLLYMNSAANSELTDFAIDQIRYYRVYNGNLEIREDERDLRLSQRLDASGKPIVIPPTQQGQRLNRESYDSMKARGEYLRLRTR